MRFNVYRSKESAKPLLIGDVEAADPTAAYVLARATLGEGPFIVRPTKSAAELTAYIQRNNFVRGQDRIGIMVYRAPNVKRAKEELAVGHDVINLYDLTKGRRCLQTWDRV